MASHFFFPIGGHLHICPLISGNGNVHSRNSWLPTQQRLLGIFFCPVVRNDYLSAQWQLSVDCLLPVSDILNCRTCGAGFQIWTTQGHPPNGGSDGVCICYTCNLVPHNAAGTHTGNPRSHAAELVAT